ncbi:MAG: B12-binding domain-containing radical SAM protein [Lachnospiraceae bacterium]
MKILLAAVNAKYIHSNLAVYCLKAYTRAYGDQIEIGEYTINHTKDYILADIYKRKPDVVCFSCYIWNSLYVRDLICELGKVLPKVPIWAGGPEVSYDAETFLQENPNVTGVMRGEGEEIFKNLCKFYLEEGNLGEIKGITYRDQEGVHCNENQPPIQMDQIPFYYKDVKEFEHRIIYYESSRGCPFQCSYCLSSVDKTLRFRSMNLVKEELLFFLQAKVPQVKFVDRTFNCNHQHAMDIWNFIKEQDNGSTNFHFEIAGDLLTCEEVEFLATLRPGLVQLEIGVQTTNEKVIQIIRRVMDFQKVASRVEKIRDGHNIHQHLDLIAGLPLEDLKSFQTSFDAVYELRPQQLQLGFLKVLKGSFMEEHAAEYGILYHSQPPYEVLSTRELSYGDMICLKQIEEVLEVYYNSGQYQTTIGLLNLQFQSAYQMYASLADFYQERNYFNISHSRMKRYEILLEFIETVDHPHSACYKEALTYDLYLRENLKSRPDFAPDYAVDKEMRGYLKGRRAHIEKFSFDFITLEAYRAQAYPEQKETYILFDYDRRNPQSAQAAVERYQR